MITCEDKRLEPILNLAKNSFFMGFEVGREYSKQIHDGQVENEQAKDLTEYFTEEIKGLIEKKLSETEEE